MDKKIFLVLLALSFASPSGAYDNIITHPDLTRAAVDKSVASPGAGLMKDLGLDSWVGNPQFPFYLGRGAPSYLIAKGVRLEDDPEPRVANHFYDPVHGRPLTVSGVALGKASPAWALEGFPFEGEEIPEQDFSLSDARRSMYQALTEPGPQARRDQYWADTFRRLGQVIHHIQDMAQPQHVRNDQHVDKWYLWPYYNPSLYERYTMESRGRVLELAASGQVQAAFPGAPELRHPFHFWVNDAHVGMAEFTNRNFISQGTNFALWRDQVVTPMYSQPVPGTPRDYTLEDLYGAPASVPPHMASLCSGQGAACIMTMYPSVGPTLAVEKASTLSIYDQDLRNRGLEVIYDRWDEDIQYTVTRLFSLNRFNMDEAHRVLIPRTVSYSAGFINYFFRGKLEIEPPELGAYAYADQTAGEGFSKMRAKIRNVTPLEGLNGGTVGAVVKFRRNECYEPDLSGEFSVSPSGGMVFPRCDEGESFVTNEVFITKSQEQSLTLGSGQEREVTFTFLEPIPFNATDVYLQVIYRGRVGAEVDSIAVGTEDISEPTFSAISNATDVFVIPDRFNRGTIHYWRDIRARIAEPPYSVVDLNQDGNYASPPDVNIEGGDIHVDIYLDGGLIGHVPALPEGRFARIALLLGSSGNIHLHVTGTGLNNVYSDSVTPRIWRLDWERRRYDFSLLWLGRNELLQAHAAFFLRYLVPPYDSDTLFLKPSLMPDATQPLQATMVPMSTGEAVGSRWLGEGLLAESVTPDFFGHLERRGGVIPTGEYFAPAAPSTVPWQPASYARFAGSERTRMSHLEATPTRQVSAPAAGAPPGR
ncbi:hypothetical protein [Hyalangium rubrum]|uniref:Uncharacterized protein n=1 Tax=Hyalangium rubrum TaxID=3103134 RepID=A0ABU5H7U4_9BACT|nr:hypothetical protein [Hyalangium sp. s54d21]MDY7229532.1 hypothetical protein [Hyalangium sp. s54d21]